MILASITPHHSAPASAGATLSLSELAAVVDGLAGLVLTEPKPETLHHAKAFFHSLPHPLQPQETTGTTPLEPLREEYFALLLASSSGRYTPPYASVWIEGRFNAGSTQIVQNLYAETGFDPWQLPMSEHWRNPFLPDHIGFELAFTAGLLYSAQEADSGKEQLLNTARDWAANHLTQWIPAFSHALGQRAETPVYSALAKTLDTLFAAPS
ncbi:MAG: TorD/DmsD family molecular chaperone [Thermodesulfobacteriota bacterium]